MGNTGTFALSLQNFPDEKDITGRPHMRSFYQQIRTYGDFFFKEPNLSYILILGLFICDFFKCKTSLSIEYNEIRLYSILKYCIIKFFKNKIGVSVFCSYSIIMNIRVCLLLLYLNCTGVRLFSGYAIIKILQCIQGQS